MDGGASGTISSAGYTAPSQSESAVGSVNGGAQKEVFWIGWAMDYSYSSKAAANQACIDAGADGLATNEQLMLAGLVGGAQWCACGWLQDTDDRKYPMQETKAGCGVPGVNNCGAVSWAGGRAGANCYGFKPSPNDGLSIKTSSTNIVQTLTINKTGRYVRIRPSETADGYMHFSQIVVKNTSGANISQGKPTYATSYLTCCGGSPSSAVVVDGNIRTRGWAGSGGGVWHSGKQIVVGIYDEEYFEIDLGSVQEISTIDYYGRSDSTGAELQRNSGLSIEIAKSPRPKRFSDRAQSESWNQRSKINTLTCPAGTEKIKCGEVEACLTAELLNQSATTFTSPCAQSCPRGTNFDVGTGRCKP